MAEELDESVAAFRHRPLDEAGPFTFAAAYALTMKVREGGRVINAGVRLATSDEHVTGRLSNAPLGLRPT